MLILFDMEKSIRQKVEDWLNKRPLGITIKEINISQVIETMPLSGQYTPIVLRGGYEGTIEFECDKWEEDE